MSYLLHIGNKRYSSWSLRGWLLFEAFGVPFEARLTPMYTDDFIALKAKIAPGRQVPTLVWRPGGASDDVVIWDSLAIAEFLAERHPEAGHWPADVAARAMARSLAAEMHSGFQALRGAMPMNLMDRYPGRGRDAAVLADVARLEDLWGRCRVAYGAGGPYLFGARFTAADAFFAPVAFRVETYDAPLGDEAAAYCAALRAHPAMVTWRADAAAEPWVEPRYRLEA